MIINHRYSQHEKECERNSKSVAFSIMRVLYDHKSNVKHILINRRACFNGSFTHSIVWCCNKTFSNDCIKEECLMQLSFAQILSF